MVFEFQFVRKAYAQRLAHEMRQAVRMLRAFPLEQLDERDTGCGRTARELAEGFISHLHRLDAIATGSEWAIAPRGSRTRGSILLELETCYLGAHAAVETLPAERWSEVVRSPRGLSPWGHARRGELLWMALRNLIRHSRHFGQHHRSACRGPKHDGHDGGSRVLATESAESLAVGA